MSERFSGNEKKWDLQRVRETARIFGWAVASAMIVGGVVLSSEALVHAGIITALIDATADVAAGMVLGIGKNVKNDVLGSNVK